MKPPLRAVLFDLDGTLYDMRRMKLRLLRRIPGEWRRHGLGSSIRRFRALQAFRRAREARRGEGPVDDLLESLVAEVAERHGWTAETVRRAIREFMVDSEFGELRGLSPPGDRAVLEELARRGYALGVLSEYPVDRKLAALGLLDLPWSARVDCEMVGVLKPDPAAFLAAAEQMGHPVGETLMVGDRLDADVAGAARAGMRSAWLMGRTRAHGPGPAPDHVISSLGELLDLLPGLEPAGEEG